MRELARANGKTHHTRTKAKGILILDRAAKHSLTALVQTSADDSDSLFVSSSGDITASAERNCDFANLSSFSDAPKEYSFKNGGYRTSTRKTGTSVNENGII